MRTGKEMSSNNPARKFLSCQHLLQTSSALFPRRESSRIIYHACIQFSSACRAAKTIANGPAARVALLAPGCSDKIAWEKKTVPFCCEDCAENWHGPRRFVSAFKGRPAVATRIHGNAPSEQGNAAGAAKHVGAVRRPARFPAMSGPVAKNKFAAERHSALRNAQAHGLANSPRQATMWACRARARHFGNPV